MAELAPEGDARQQAEQQTHAPHPDTHLALIYNRRFWITLGLLLIASGLIVRIAGYNKGLSPRVRYVPVTRKIASGRVLVKPLGYAQYSIEITAEMRNAQVAGNFAAYGGPTNTVSAVIMQESAYATWIQGNKADAFYSSDGQKNTDQFSVRLSPGKYVFAISNRLSKSSQKYVYLEVDLIYYRPEAY